MVRTLDKLGNFLLKWRISKKALAIIFVVLFVLSLVPIVITAFYSVPVADDYTFGLRSHLAYVHGDSFLGGVLESCDFFYNNWQGFYTSNFIASIQPFNIDVNLYWISNIAVLFSICFSLFFFIKTILVKVLCANKWDYLLISIPIVTLFLQFMPGIQEGIYWMDGSLSMLVLSMYLIIFSLIVRCHFAVTKKKRVLSATFTVIISLLFSGVGPAALVTVVLTFVPSLIYCLIKKYNVYKLMIIVMAIVLIGFLISAVAPGNKVRMQTVSGMSIPMSVFKAVVMSMYQLGEWFTLFYFAVIIFLTVVFYGIAERTNYQFKNPLLVFIICYAVYAGRISVEYYAKGTIGSWRQYNWYYLSFIICITISILYFVGWLSKRKLFHLQVNRNNNRYVSIVLILIIAFCFASGSMNYYHDHVVSSVSLMGSFIKGDTQKYKEEMMERISLLEDDSTKIVELQPISVCPKFLGADMISADKDFWQNTSMADYYEKEEIVLATETNSEMSE